MRARELDAPPFAGARFGVELGVVGIGGALELTPADLDEALELTAVAHGPKSARMLARFAALPTGSLVWTRTDEASYRLGRVRGPWRWTGTAGARRVGIHNVRDTDWLSPEFDRTDVPPAVAATFDRGGRNLQRTHDAEAERATAELWSRSAPPATA